MHIATDRDSRNSLSPGPSNRNKSLLQLTCDAQRLISCEWHAYSCYRLAPFELPASPNYAQAGWSALQTWLQHPAVLWAFCTKLLHANVPFRPPCKTIASCQIPRTATSRPVKTSIRAHQLAVFADQPHPTRLLPLAAAAARVAMHPTPGLSARLHVLCWWGPAFWTPDSLHFCL